MTRAAGFCIRLLLFGGPRNMTDTAAKGGDTTLFCARSYSTEIEARPAPTTLPTPQTNPPAKRRYYLYLMAPAITILAFISLYPFFSLIVMSFQKGGSGPTEWVGFKNYVRLGGDERFLSGWVLLLQYSAMCLTLQLGIGLLLAVIVNNSRFEKFLVTALLMPMMMAPVVTGLVWLFLYNGTFGWNHWVLQSLGILDGASPLRNFFAITLPTLYPVLLIAIILLFIDNFCFFDAALVLTGGGSGDSTKILPIYLFEVAFKFFKLERAAAIALTLLLVTIILGKTLVRIFEQPKSERV